MYYVVTETKNKQSTDVQLTTLSGSLIIIIIGSTAWPGPGLPEKLLPAEVSGYCFYRFRDKRLLLNANDVAVVK
jgi:hypothetical protein